MNAKLYSNRDLARIALFAALIAVLGLVPKIDLPIAAGVPITAQTLGVMLAGLVLGARNGALSVLLFLALVALGMPFLAGGRGGLGVFFSPTAGFLAGWVFGALVIGLIAGPAARAALPRLFLAVVAGGIITIYVFGIAWLAWFANMSLQAAALAAAVFIPGDIIKAIIAVFVARKLPDVRS